MKNKDGNDNEGSHPDGIFFILYSSFFILHFT